MITRPALLATFLLAAGCASAPPAPEVIAPPGTRVGDLPFSPAVRAGDFLYLSGAIGEDIFAEGRILKRGKEIIYSAFNASGTMSMHRLSIATLEVTELPITAACWDIGSPALTRDSPFANR